MTEEGKGEMTVSEAGRRGGEKTAKTHGHKFYESIGKRGGQKGGSIGGRATRERYGHEFYEEIGHKGGQKVKKLIEGGKRTRE